MSELNKVLTGEEAEVFHDATEIIDKWLQDPKVYRLVLEHRTVLDRCYQQWCAWGCCEMSIDPLTNRIEMAIGPVGCGCDFKPGWRSKYVDGLPKPGWNAKPVGRHGGRIARSRRLTREHQRFVAEVSETFKDR